MDSGTIGCKVLTKADAPTDRLITAVYAIREGVTVLKASLTQTGDGPWSVVFALPNGTLVDSFAVVHTSADGKDVARDDAKTSP